MKYWVYCSDCDINIINYTDIKCPICNHYNTTLRLDDDYGFEDAIESLKDVKNQNEDLLRTLYPSLHKPQ
jgi:uncharacterized Zn finger protein (UPF0148 family)